MRALCFIAALLSLVAIAHAQSNVDEIQRLQDQIQHNRQDSLAHYQLGEIYFQQKNYQTAANEYREALNGNLQPKVIEVLSHLALAKIFDISGQHDRAENERRLAARSEPTGGPTRDPLAALAAEQKKQDDPPITSPAAFRTATLPLIGTPVLQTEPEYSDEARAAGLEGTVFVEFSLNAAGTPIDVHAISHLGLGLDEKALDAVRQWRFDPPAPGTLPPNPRAAVNFLLPAKMSRWHLVGASFAAPEGAARPTFLQEPYPLGAGISDRAIDEGWVINAIRRPATVTLLLDVDEHGIPSKFQVVAASVPLWGNEAIAVVRKWRFAPGVKDGKEISVPCTLDLVWGQKVWTAEMFAAMRRRMSMAAKPLDQPSTPPPGKATITTAYIIDGNTPHWPYSVVVIAAMGGDGVPTTVSLVRSLAPDYDAKAIDAVRQWRFIPPLVNGRTVSVPVFVEIDFGPNQ